MTNIDVICPHCGAQLETDETRRGTEARCPNCREMFTIPHMADIPILAEKKPGISFQVSTSTIKDIALVVLGILVLVLVVRGCRTETKTDDGNSIVQTPPVDHNSRSRLARNIEKLIVEDHVCGGRHSVNPNNYSGMNDFADAVAREKRAYVSEMSAFISRVELPDDFKSAFLAHLSAHGELARRLANHPYIPSDDMEGFVVGLLNGLVGVEDGGVGVVNQWGAGVQGAILFVEQSWEEVRNSAIRNGAQWKPEWK